MELRIKIKLSPEEEERWEELKNILGTPNNAKTLKKIIEVVKL